MPFVPDPIQPNDVKYPGATPGFVPDAVQPTNAHPTIPGATPGFVPDPGQENPLLNHIQNPNTPIDQKQATISAITSYAKSIGNFALGAVKSLGETATRQMTRPGGPNPLISAASPLIPEKVDLPIVGETSLKYSSDPLTMAKQGAEDLLNVLPGGAETKTATELAEQGAKGFAGKLMKSAFRVGENDLKKNPNLIRDFLVERLGGLTKRGIASDADATVSMLENELDGIIKTAAEKGVTVDAKEIAKRTEPLVKRYENSAFPEYAQTVKDKVANFLKRGQIPVDEAQEFKKNTYGIIKESGYGHLLGPDKETGKQLARGVKEEIEKAIPNFKVADTNKKLAIYGKARDLMLRQINKAGPNELLPLKDIVATGATHSIIPAIARRVIESVPFKTFVANTLTSTKTQAIKNAAKIAAPLINQAIK